MTAALVSIAEAVRGDLVLGPTITPAGSPTADVSLARIGHALSVSRSYLPRFDAPELAEGTYQVIVSPAGEETRRITRGTLGVEYSIEIGVCAKLANDDNATVDAVLAVLEQMSTYWFQYGLTGGAATWIRNEVLAWPNREMIGEGGVAFAIWVAVFEGARS